MKKIHFLLPLVALAFLVGSCTKPCPCEEEVITLQGEKNLSAAQLSTAMADMDSVFNAFEQVEALKMELKSAQDSNKVERAKEIAALINAKFTKSEERIAELDKAIAKSSRKLVSMRKVVANLKAQLESTRTQVAELQGQVENLQSTVESQNQALQTKEGEISETKGQNEALNMNLRNEQRKAFLEKGQSFIDRGKQAEAAGDALSGFINGKKKKAQYLLAQDLFNKALDHFTNIPGGIGGYSGDTNERQDFDDKTAEAQQLLNKLKEKLK